MTSAEVVERHRAAGRAFTAAGVGMSRESAYRLRRRPTGARFAAAWDLALAEARRPHEGKAPIKSHSESHRARRNPPPAGDTYGGKGHEGHARLDSVRPRQPGQAIAARPGPGDRRPGVSS